MPFQKYSFFQATAIIDDSQQFISSIKSAIDIGYRHIDCAAYYHNEKQLGKAINDKILEGVIKRDELFITSKVFCGTTFIKNINYNYFDVNQTLISQCL